MFFRLVKQFLQSHDAVRVVQCLMALKDKSICAKLFDETKGRTRLHVYL